MIPAAEAVLIVALRGEADRLQQQAAALEFDAQDLRYQAEEIAKVYGVA
jgi:hypothetical protein